MDPMSDWFSTGFYNDEPATEKQVKFLRNCWNSCADQLTQEELVACELMTRDDFLEALPKTRASELISFILKPKSIEKIIQESLSEERKPHVDAILELIVDTWSNEKAPSLMVTKSCVFCGEEFTSVEGDKKSLCPSCESETIHVKIR